MIKIYTTYYTTFLEWRDKENVLHRESIDNSSIFFFDGNGVVFTMDLGLSSLCLMDVELNDEAIKRKNVVDFSLKKPFLVNRKGNHKDVPYLYIPTSMIRYEVENRSMEEILDGDVIVSVETYKINNAEYMGRFHDNDFSYDEENNILRYKKNVPDSFSYTHQYMERKKLMEKLKMDGIDIEDYYLKKLLEKYKLTKKRKEK